MSGESETRNMGKSRLLLLAAFFSLLAAALACNYPVVTPSPVVPVLVTAAGTAPGSVTSTPAVVFPTPILIPTTPLPASPQPTRTATPVSIPTTPPVQGDLPLQMPAGATSVEVSGSIPQGGQRDYVLYLSGGQTLMVTVDSTDQQVVLGVTGLSDGQPYLRPAAGATQFNDTLSMSQPYRLTLVSPATEADFRMQVVIPVRIRFAPGGRSTTLKGNVLAGSMNHYLLKALRGQTMTVSIQSPGSDVLLSIYGMADGMPLVRAAADAVEWSGVLPASQDYMIQAVSSGATSEYTLDVTVK